MYMLAVNYSNVRENLKEYCDRVVDASEVVVITRKDNRSAVLISLNEYSEMQAAMKALRNAEYLEKLQRSVQQLADGGIVVKTEKDLGINA